MSNSLNTMPAKPVDPFEISLTLADQRLRALRLVKLAQEHLRDTHARSTKNIAAAEIALTNAMIDADRIGAYSLIPAEARPSIPHVEKYANKVVSAGGAS